jgi:hypothetical protein
MTAPADAPITEQEVEAMAQRIAQWSDFNRAEAATLLRRLRAELDALLRVVAAADAMRDMGVSIGQQVVHPEGMPDDRALYEFIGLFDGPFQRDYDAARAALKEPK